MNDEKKDLEDVLNPDDFEEELEDDTDGDVDSTDETDKESTSKDDSEDNAKSEDEDEEEKQKRINAKNAERRRRKQQREKERLANEQKIKDSARLEGELSMMKINPYTNEKIEDEEDLKIYKIQKEIDDNGGDPIADLPKQLAIRNRKLANEQKEKERAVSAEQEKINKEVEEFRQNNPNVNTRELASNEKFMKIVDEKQGRWTLQECYEKYLQDENKINKSKEEEKDKKIIDDASKKQTKVPSSSSGGVQKPIDVDNMSTEEFEIYWKNKYS